MTLLATPQRSWHMARKNVVLVIVLLIGLTFSACGGKSTPDVQAVETQTAAKIFATQTASVPTQPVTPQAAIDAIDSLRRMESALEIGISYQEYRSRMIDLKGDVDEAIAQLPDGELKKELGLAMEAYGDALTAWSDVIQNQNLFSASEPGKSLRKKYSIPEAGAGGYMLRDTALLTIWTVAGEHINRASELVGQ
jgi:hypothetical protein